MTSLFFLAASYALLALALCFTLSSVISAKETNLQSVLVGLKIISSLLVWRTVLRAARFLSVLAVGMALGWTARQWKMDSNTYVRYNLSVLEQDGRLYHMQTENKQPFQTVFCEDVPFRVGQRIKLLKYEDRGTCWSVKDSKLGYILAKGDNDYGFDSNSYPHSNAHAVTLAIANPR